MCLHSEPYTPRYPYGTSLANEKVHSNLTVRTNSILFRSREGAFESDIPYSQDIFPLLSKCFPNIDVREMKGLKKAFRHSQANSTRLALSPLRSPSEMVYSEGLGPQDARSRQSSSITTATVGSNEIHKIASARDPVVVYLTPLKDESGKVAMFVFILATGV